MTMVREIQLTQNRVALCSDEDHEMLSKYRFHFDGSYPRAYVKGSYKTKQKQVRMHQLIMPCEPGFMIDHIDGNKLNNTRENLRIVDVYQNSQNSKKKRSAKTTSEYKGVSWHSERKKWRSEIAVDNQRAFIGLYDDEEECARASDSACLFYHGEFAVTNFKDSVPKSLDQLKEENKLHQQAKNKYLGVAWHPQKKKWLASITINNVSKALGFFDEPEDAARKYDEAMRARYGPNARTNFKLNTEVKEELEKEEKEEEEKE